MDLSFAVNDFSDVELLELRRSDAWIPSAKTSQSLLEGVTEPATLPGLLVGESGMQGTKDPIRSLLSQLQKTEAVADSLRFVITADVVSQDFDGLRQLIDCQWHHAALDLNHRLLTSCGHGLDCKGQPSAKLTPVSAQLWLLRFALLKQTQQFSLMERELEAFGGLDNTDVYFQHAPHLYPGRQGSMIPFSLRLIHAELPRFLSRAVEALNRLCCLLSTVDCMIGNLEKGLTEDGTASSPTEAYKTSSLRLWRMRKCRIYSHCLSIYLDLQDYPSAIETVHQMIGCLEPLGEHRFLYGALGRIYLKFGDVESAERMFEEALVNCPPDAPETRTHQLMYNALLRIGNGHFEDAKRLMREVLQIDPSNVAAVNNMAVCSLYLGHLEEGIALLEALTTPRPLPPPSTACGGGHAASSRLFPLHEVLVSNLAVLYEVESERGQVRKLQLLERLAGVPGERIPPRAFKLALPSQGPREIH